MISDFGRVRRQTNPVRTLVNNPGFAVTAFLFAHIPLALITRQFQLLASIHALVTLAIGAWWALTRPDPRRSMVAAAYIVGAEVLWRMTGAGVFWEFGKYATVLVLGLAIIRSRASAHLSVLPILYFALLIPAAVLTIGKLGLTETARGALSFYLGGPLALAVAGVWFSRTVVTPSDLQDMAISMLGPIVGIGALTLRGTLVAPSLAFTTESNFATSGGFGPNQVSAMLGLGALLCLMLVLQSGQRARRWPFLLVMSWLLIQSLLTFSRGGVFNFIICAAFATLCVARQRSQRVVLAVTALTLLTGGYTILPRLDVFTGGMLGRRFLDIGTTHRLELVLADLNLWRENPLWGVGTGLSKYERVLNLDILVANHTEYTRLLAEHGLLGFIALTLLVMMALGGLRNSASPQQQTWTVPLITWAALETGHSDMRLAAVAFVFGLALVRWRPADPTTQGRGLGFPQ